MFGGNGGGPWSRWCSSPRRLLLARVVAERAGGRELAELVAHHRLADVDGHVLAAVVHRNGVADHLRCDGRAPRPRLDHLAVAGRVLRVHLLGEVVVDERTLLQAARHVRLLSHSSRSLLAGVPDSLTLAPIAGCRGCDGGARSSRPTSCPSCGCGPPVCPTATPGGGHPSSSPHHH